MPDAYEKQVTKIEHDIQSLFDDSSVPATRTKGAMQRLQQVCADNIEALDEDGVNDDDDTDDDS